VSLALLGPTVIMVLAAVPEAFTNSKSGMGVNMEHALCNRQAAAAHARRQ